MLWLMKRRIQEPVYDCFNGFVVRAPTEESAREMAASFAADEGAATWTSQEGSTCETIPEHGGDGVLLSDFNAG